MSTFNIVSCGVFLTSQLDYQEKEARMSMPGIATMSKFERHTVDGFRQEYYGPRITRATTFAVYYFVVYLKQQSVQSLADEFGVTPSTIEAWYKHRQDAETPQHYAHLEALIKNRANAAIVKWLTAALATHGHGES